MNNKLEKNKTLTNKNIYNKEVIIDNKVSRIIKNRQNDDGGEFNNFSQKAEEYIKGYIPIEGDFDTDIDLLNKETERPLVHAFVRALIMERSKTEYEAADLAYAIADLSYSGWLGELFAYAATLSQKPPGREPAVNIDDSDEDPAQRIINRFAYWLKRDRMHLGVLRTLNMPLYDDLYSWKRSNTVPDVLAKRLVTKKQYNDRRIASERPTDYEGKHRLTNIKASRKRL